MLLDVLLLFLFVSSGLLYAAASSYTVYVAILLGVHLLLVLLTFYFFIHYFPSLLQGIIALSPISLRLIIIEEFL